MVLSELKRGQTATIESFTDLRLALKFMEVGVVPSEEVTIYTVAPLGDPIAVEVSGSKISMRLSEAKTIKIKLV